MSRLYLFIAALFALAGLVASYFAPTENMGAQEAFYAHLLLITPPLFIGTVISALALILRRLEQLLEKTGVPHDHSALPQNVTPAAMRDFSSLAEQLHATPQTSEPEISIEFDDLVSKPGTGPAPSPPVQDDSKRAPTVDEFLVKGAAESEAKALSPKLAREGVFSGRNYRLYEDGSLEIDTDQSTIRFDSLDEFRNFVSSASA